MGMFINGRFHELYDFRGRSLLAYCLNALHLVYISTSRHVCDVGITEIQLGR